MRGAAGREKTIVSHIILFDVDKTLVARSTAHLTAFFDALAKVYGVNTHPNVITHHGMTDQQIIREVLKVTGVSEAAADAGLNRCMAFMVERFNQLNRTDRVEVLPGVVPLLDELTRREAFVGLVTGNLEPIAWGKLDKAGIAAYFSFGGFGSDHIDRREMAALAIRRCIALHPAAAGCPSTLFGDTPFDIAAARAIGARAIGVCTGHPSREDLQSAGADILFDNLADTQLVASAIWNG